MRENIALCHHYYHSSLFPPQSFVTHLLPVLICCCLRVFVPGGGAIIISCSIPPPSSSSSPGISPSSLFLSLALSNSPSLFLSRFHRSSPPPSLSLVFMFRPLFSVFPLFHPLLTLSLSLAGAHSLALLCFYLMFVFLPPMPSSLLPLRPILLLHFFFLHHPPYFPVMSPGRHPSGEGAA